MSFGPALFYAVDAHRAQCSSQTSPRIRGQLLASALVQKLAAGNNVLKYGFKAAAVAGQLASCLLYQKVVGERQTTPQSIRQEFANEVVQKIFFAVIANIVSK